MKRILARAFSSNKDIRKTVKVSKAISGISAAERIQLDTNYYRKKYSDLSTLSDAELKNHWKLHGYNEGRFASASHEAGDANLVVEDKGAEQDLAERHPIINHIESVDFKFYTALYPDLLENGIKTSSQANNHYQKHGKKEGRSPNLRHWFKVNDLTDAILPDGECLDRVYGKTSLPGLGITLEELLNRITGANSVPFNFYDEPLKNGEYYVKLGKYYAAKGDKNKAKLFLRISLFFTQSPEALELLGDYCLESGHYNIALSYYNAAIELPVSSKLLYLSRAKCFEKLSRYDDALKSLTRSYELFPEFTSQFDRFDEITEKAWSDFYPILLVDTLVKKRDKLIEEMTGLATSIYNLYLLMFGGVVKDEIYHDINTSKILIIGDYHVPQCERYRINQKVEQLEALGKTVTCVNWVELDKHQNQVALHDFVIFYRVPAVPKVLKAMAQVNATGKVSLYEIDDLLFDPVYPPAIESYGGYVTMETYRELTRGMAMFNAAARFCRYGIASTEALRESLEQLVFGKRCLLHRNGLDHLNKFRISDKSNKRTIDIFYGSGTMAHNSDFTDLALPAIEKVLSEEPRARLVVVGYLKLPNRFVERYKGQISLLPPVKSVQGYWSLLEQADINLAVLHDDQINACKSELKWFEAACFGIPSILSSTSNYRDVVKNGEDAFLAETADDWYRDLSALVKDHALRTAVGMSAYNRVKEEYSIGTLGNSLEAQLADLVKNGAKTRRKLALVNVFFPPQSIGGATRVMADNFDGLRRHYSDELDVCVFTADAECRKPHQLMAYEYKGTRVYRGTTLWREHMDWNAKDPEMYRLFTEFLEFEKPDIVHFHCVQRLTASIVEAARDAGIPYMITAHDAWWISDFQFLVDHQGKVYPEGHPDSYEAIELPPNISLAESIERRRDLKDLLRSAKKILTVSNAFADIYRKNGVNNIEVTKNGISDELPWSNKDTAYSDKVVCGHIGGMSEHKGYYLLKDAILELQPENLEFIIVDHSKDEGYELKSFWGKVPVTFIGRLAQSKITELYRKLDVLFAPSTWPESFGLVTREAAACGCWVVASNMGGIGEDVIDGKNGFVVEPSLNSLKSTIYQINRKSAKYKQCAPGNTAVFALKQTEALIKEYMNS